MANKALPRYLQQVIKLAAVQTARERGDRELLERFVAHQDEAAFAVLVERHGPMVLGVSRRRLANAHDAEDACQAAFLVLAQKADSIRKTTSLSSWLHSVAARAAGHLHREQQRRGRRERKVARPAAADPAAEVSWREVQTVLDEELERLPDRLRAPLILCYLDGQPRDVAARQLGVSVACLHGRLERGRKALCERLTRRGVTLSAALVAAALGEGAARAALPPTTALHTARAAVRIALGHAPPKGLICPPILSLAQEVARSMFPTKMKLIVPAILCAALLAGAIGNSLAPVGADKADKAPPAARDSRPASRETKAAPAATPSGQAKPVARGAKQTTVRGRVLDLARKPLAGAKVYLLKWKMPAWLGRPEDKGPPKVWARTGKDGRFSVSVAERDLGELFVTAAGYGPGWVIKPGRLQETWPIDDNQEVRLARDDVTVRGRLLDLQGQPVAGAVIRVHALKASADGSLEGFIKAIKDRAHGARLSEHELLSAYHVDGLAHFFPPIKTDKAGRFQIKGVGRDRVVSFTVEAPAIETKVLQVLTRTDVKASDLRVPEVSIITPTGTKELSFKPCYPATFTHVAAQGRVITGVVRDKETGKPIAGAVVRSEQPIRYPVYYNETTTDPKGRFRLTGMALNPQLGMNSSVVALPPERAAYLALHKGLPQERGTKTAVLDFDLPPGAWLEGQVKDKATGRGVQAQLGYQVLANGLPPLRPPTGPVQTSLYRDPYLVTDVQGKFRLVVARQRALIGATAVGGEGRYRTGVGADKIKELKDAKDGVPVPSPTVSFGTFDTVVEIKPEKGAKRLHCDILLDPGRTVMIEVRGPNGKPLKGVQALGRSAREYYDTVNESPLGASFEVYALEPGKGRTLLLVHREKNLAARCELKGDERGPVVVTLRPAASVVGRLVDEQSQPRARADIQVYIVRTPTRVLLPVGRPLRTDAQGKFRIDGLVPGVSYRADAQPIGVYGRPLFEGLSLKSGQVKVLGEVKPRQGDSE
jgi:RNA polymerase sigma factor (sigma-70 family)